MGSSGPEDPRVTPPPAPGDIVRGRLLPTTSAPREGERVDVLVSAEDTIIEHILSGSLARPVEFLQDHIEWVVVLAGGAQLDVAGERVDLSPGEWVLIPAETPHRVMSTQAGTEWLAVHLPRGRCLTTERRG